ncbi:N-acetylneuraminate lyase B-like [Chironomus tepperi]|uniref:N-acetylneuraminate lyase B-like n=1 Tax=Chironomus tepperi TaxID=113505 RepID=UPI00391F6981
MSKLINFKGLMAPVFTAFDSNNDVNLEIIEEYARVLKDSGISAVLVNGTSGEGMSMNVNERKLVTEKWHQVCQKLEIVLMVQISGCCFRDIIDLAKQAENLKVDGVLCLPELYFKPKDIQSLVNYLKKISIYCPSIPLYYYHIPMFTNVDIPMASFMELAKSEIATFSGIKYTSGDLEKGLQCLKHGQVFLGSDTILCGALALGFSSAIMTSLNINPEISLKILQSMNDGEIDNARKHQMTLCDIIDNILIDGGGNWVPSMKKAFNKKFNNLQLGCCRDPL